MACENKKKSSIKHFNNYYIDLKPAFKAIEMHYAKGMKMLLAKYNNNAH